MTCAQESNRQTKDLEMDKPIAIGEILQICLICQICVCVCVFVCVF